MWHPAQRLIDTALFDISGSSWGRVKWKHWASSVARVSGPVHHWSVCVTISGPLGCYFKPTAQLGVVSGDNGEIESKGIVCVCVCGVCVCVCGVLLCEGLRVCPDTRLGPVTGLACIYKPVWVVSCFSSVWRYPLAFRRWVLPFLFSHQISVSFFITDTDCLLIPDQFVQSIVLS